MADHHIYCGSPVLERRKDVIFKVSRDEGVPVWKVRRVSAPEALKPGELYITHHKVNSEIDCAHALSVLGCSETVLVVEGLMTLEAEYNQVFEEKRETALRPEDINLIMDSLRSEEAKHCFSRFAHALYKGTSPSANPHVRNAIARTGARLFWDVAHVVAAKFPDHAGLQRMLASDDARLQMLAAWSHVFTLRTERHINSHPYDIIGGDLEMAAKAMAVLNFVAQEYKGSKEAKRRNLAHLLQASLPFVEASIDTYKKKEVHRKQEEDFEVETMKRLLLLPRHLEKN